MAYCVNCGVELGKTEEQCPLCGTAAYQPPEESKKERERPWPSRVDRVTHRAERRFVASFISVFLLVPILICLVNDMMLTGKIDWSLYVVCGVFVVFSFFVFPMFFRKPKRFLFLALDTASVLLLLFVIWQNTGGGVWLYTLGIPLALGAASILGFFVYWFSDERRTSIFLSAAFILYATGIYTMFAEILLNIHHNASWIPNWSWYTFIPCVLLGTIFVIANRRRRWREEIRRRFFY